MGDRNDVSSDIYDNPYTFDNGKMTFKGAVDFLKSTNFDEDINMNNNQIKKMFKMVSKIMMSQTSSN